jgi:hypothetical protein
MGTQNYVVKFGAGGSADTDSVMYDDGTNVGIGINTPGDTLELKGNTKNLAFCQTADSYPTLQVLNYCKDNVAICFDSYYRGGGWKSSDTGSNFRVYKINDKLRFCYASGFNAGNTITDWSSENNNCAIVIKNDGNVGIGETNPVNKLHVQDTSNPPIRLDCSTSSGKTGQNVYVPISINGTTYYLRLYS